MEKKWSLVIVLIVVVSLLLSIFGSASADSGCSFDGTVCFENEIIMKQIGSYTMVDQNGRYLQSNQWKNSIDLLFNGDGCVYPLPDTQTTFYANWHKDWYWETKTDVFGYECFKLKRY